MNCIQNGKIQKNPKNLIFRLTGIRLLVNLNLFKNSS